MRALAAGPRWVHMPTPLYFDNNATTFPAPEAVEAMLPLLGEFYGNPNSQHALGQKTRHEIEVAREHVAALLHCKTTEVVFNSGATEGNNTAIYAALQARPDRKHIITVKTEHSSVLEVVRSLASRGYRVTELNVDRSGHLDLDELKNEISGDTALVSVMWANNETGVLHPVGAIGDMAKQFGALVHIDAAQAAGKLAIHLGEELAIDFLTISAHKFHGLKGCGALFVRHGTAFEPLLRGGHQEGGQRAGTENVVGIVAMGQAARLAHLKLDQHVETMRKMRDRLQRGLLDKVQDLVFHGDQVSRLPNTVSVGFKFIDGEALLMMMDAQGICATAGSACRSGSMEPSHVLQAMDTPVSSIHGSVRFCVSRYTTQAEVDELIEKVGAIVARLRQMSPFDTSAATAETGPSDAELEQHKAWFARA